MALSKSRIRAVTDHHAGIPQIAHQRAEETGSQSDDWINPLNLISASLNQDRPREKVIQAIAQACSEPSELAFLAEAAFDQSVDPASGFNPLEQLLIKVDDSAYSLKDWIDACKTLFTFLEARDRHTDLGSAMEFLTCCSQYAITHPNPLSLSELTEDMLCEFGFEG